MSRSEKLLTVLLIIFVALTLALIALLFTYNFVRTDGQVGSPILVEAVEPDYYAQDAEGDEYEAVLANVGQSLTEALSPDQEEPEEVRAEPDRVDAYTRIVFERNYVLDGIVLTSEEPIPHFAINMDRESLARIYGDWEIVDFTPGLVTMRLNIVNQRAEHYVVTEHDGFVAVFVRTGGDPLRLTEITRTPVSSLSPGEQARIREGIIVHSEEALLRVIQDYES
ncbi:MAG: hypothetical protein FWE20_06900 [Defluviitaleaceae bacterium]|nr:hypothetical protein [Defluviitaleaceae bacterium]